MCSKQMALITLLVHLPVLNCVLNWLVDPLTLLVANGSKKVK